MGGDVAQLVERRTGTPLRQVRFPGAAREFSTFGIRTPPCAIACIYICVRVKDPVVHVRVRWIMETLKHLACTVGWVAQLCSSWRSPGKQPEFPLGEIPMGQYSGKKKEFCGYSLAAQTAQNTRVLRGPLSSAASAGRWVPRCRHKLTWKPTKCENISFLMFYECCILWSSTTSFFCLLRRL